MAQEKSFEEKWAFVIPYVGKRSCYIRLEGALIAQGSSNNGEIQTYISQMPDKTLWCWYSRQSATESFHYSYEAYQVSPKSEE